MNPKVDQYLAIGCGRCPLGNTPECKVNNWKEELKLLRKVVLECGLNEEVKWAVPVYTFQKKNLAVVAAFKNYCALSFFNGALLHDSKKLLEKPGENTQAARLFRFTNLQQIIDMQATIKAYIFEAIEIEKAGLQIEFKETKEFNMPEEFQNKLDENPNLQTAFSALTPGRQRGYLLYFSQAKQSKTRVSRIEKYIPQILEGRGLND